MNPIIPFLAGIFLSAIAAYYSIVGLTAIFPGAVISIAVMGVALELGKLVAASWVFRNWKTSPFLLKSYLSTAVIILMLITSMGIFGLLAKAHSSTASVQNMNASRIEVVDAEIDSRQREVSLIDVQLKNMDDALSRYIELGAVSKGLKAVGELQEERKALTEERRTKVGEILKFKEERISLTDAKSKIEVEFGPVKYLADFIYGEASDSIDKAVRFVILCIIFVFDPLAIGLLIAANYSWMRQSKPNDKKEEVVAIQPTPNVEKESAEVKSLQSQEPPIPHNTRGWEWPTDRGK